MDIWGIIAIAAGLMSALNMVPQLIKSVRTKHTKDLSYGMLAIIMTGNTLWILHAAHRGDTALLVANGVLLLSAVILTILKSRYDARK